MGIARDFVRGETADAAVWMAIGMSRRQAAEFVRGLDDRPIAGFTSAALAVLVAKVLGELREYRMDACGRAQLMLDNVRGTTGHWPGD